MKTLSVLCLLCGTLALNISADGTKANQNTPTPRPGDVLTNSIGMKLVRIPAGEFQMGSPDSDPGAREDEKPQHLVRITQPFYMGTFEVTQAEFARVMGTQGSFFSRTGPGKEKVSGMNTPRFPAEQVTWHKAVEFCRRLSEMPTEKRAGRVYRLPTEAQWEYACRAGTTTAFSFGDSLSSHQANFAGNYPYGGAPEGPFLARTTEVGSYQPNAFGLYDMHGNVWEWCSDWYGLDYYKHSPRDDPPGPSTGSSRVIRGGEWYGDGRDCRSAFRYADIPNGVFYVMGFRVAMTTSNSAPLASSTVSETTKRRRPSASTTGPAAGVRPDRSRLFQGEAWPHWRGPRSNGTWYGPKLPEQWPDTGLRQIWSQPIGGGHSGVAVANSRVYTMDYRPAAASPDKTVSSGTKKGEGTERVLCFDAASGKLLWSHAYPVDYSAIEYGNGPRSTPAVFEQRVYALGAVGDLHCLDAATGKLLWSKDLVGEHQATVPLWGISASPVVFEELLIVHAAVQPNGSLLALDRRTGKEAWRNLPDPAGYSTPILIQAAGRSQLVSWTPSNIRGLDPGTGKLHWTIPFEVTYGTSIATPMFHENIVLVSGYYEGTKAIRLGKDATDARILWEDRRNLRALMCQAIYRHGYAYLLDKRHGLTCFELDTGKKIWDAGNRMTPKGRNPQATMVWTGDGDRAIVLNSDGDLNLVRLNPQGYHEQSRTRIIGHTWAHPAYAGAFVYARTDEELVCVSLLQANE